MMEQGHASCNSTRHLVKIDVLKAIAIISVVIFHMGYQEYGYLGVDIFFVINGFLIMRSILKSIDKESFSYISFLISKVLRLWPLVIIAGMVCITVGYFTMLPDDYENLAQSVVASNVFANNILACITTRNYWDVVNDFKPLMHTWYLGVVVQSYLILPIVPMLVKRKEKNREVLCVLGCIIVLLISLLIYLSNSFSEAEKFYYFPFRLFELMLGAIVACLEGKLVTFCKIKNKKIIHIGELLLTCFVMAILFIPAIAISKSDKLLIVCVITAILILLYLVEQENISSGVNKYLSQVGKCTLSIFMWHQILLAFVRYTIKTEFTVGDILVYIILVGIVSGISYHFIEKNIAKYCREKRNRINLTITCVCVCIITTLFSLMIHFRAGVVRDVPELNISTDNITPNMHAQYCDRGYQYDKEFSVDDKTKVLVIGNSFGRDWVNILLESAIAEQLDVSYIYTDGSENIKERSNRLEEADFIFYAIMYERFVEIPEVLQEWKEKVYIVGNKNFGECNGIVYNRRNEKNYFQQSIVLQDIYYEENNRMKEEYLECFIDMIGPVQNSDGSIRMFTEEGKFISQDCRHLTQSGAKYYASILDLTWIVENKIKN